MSNESISQIVERIIETLSDAVSQLVLLVIALKEQNAEMPPQLPTAANGVAKSAQTLIQVATTLADDEYGDYPDIQSQMHAAVKGVESSTAGMIAAVNNMTKTTDRQAGWDRLVEACKVIAGKTILLLQIVYGAELKRLFAAADLADDALKKVDPNGDPQDFANNASDAASKANQLAEYLRAKGNDVDAPGQKKRMLDDADRLQDDAQKYIDATNNLLNNPDDPNAQREFNDLHKKLQDDIKRAREPVKDDLKSAEDAIKRLEDQNDPNFKSLFPQDPRSKNQKAKDDLAKDDFLNDLDKRKDLQDRAGDAARRGDKPDADRYLGDMPKSHDQMKKKANDIDDPTLKKDLLDAVSNLDKLLPEQRAALQAVANNPNDDKAKDRLRDANKKADDIMDDMRNNAKPGSGFDRAADDLEDDLDRLRDAARRGDDKGVDDAWKDVQKDKPRLDQQGKRGGDRLDPKRKKDLDDALHDLDKLLPEEHRSGKDVAKNPRDKGADRKMGKIGDDLDDALNRARDPFADDSKGPKKNIGPHADQARNAANKAADAAGKGDRPGAKKHGDDLADALHDLGKDLRNLGDRTTDPDKKKRANDAADRLDDSLPEFLRASDKAANNPRDQNAQNELEDALDKVLDDIGRGKSLVDPEGAVLAAADKVKRKQKKLDDAANKGDPKGIDDARKKLQDAVDDFMDLGKELEDYRNDPSTKRKLGGALDQVGGDTPDVLNNARKLADNPRDPKAKKDYDDAAKQLRDDVDDAVDSVYPRNVDKGHQHQDELEDDAERLADAINNNRPNDAVDAARDLADDIKKMGDDLRKEGQRAGDPDKRKKLNDALNDLQKLMPEVLANTKDAVGTPNDPQRQKRAGDALDKLKGAGDDAVKELAATPDDALGGKANKGAKQADKLRDAAKDGDARGAAPPAKDLGRDLPKILEDGRQVANKKPKPDDKKKILDSLHDVGDAVPRAMRSANDAVKDPSDGQKRKKVDDDTDDLKDAFQKLADAVSPSNPDKAIDDARNRIPPAAKKVGDAAKKGDQKGLQGPLDELEDAANQLRDGAKGAKGRSDDPQKRKQLQDALNDLDDLLRGLRPDAEKAAKNPNDKNAQDQLARDLDKLQNAADRIGDATNSKPLAGLNDLDDDLDRLGNAAKKKDPKGIADAMHDLSKKVPEILNDARKQAEKEKDPVKRKRLLDAIGELENLLPGDLAPAAVKAAKNPNDPAAQKGLDDAIDRYKDALDDLNSALRPTPEDQLATAADMAKEAAEKVRKKGHEGDPKGTDQALHDLDDPLRDVRSKGRDAARREPDADKKKKLMDALHDLDKLVDPLQRSARDAAKNPKDAGKQKQLDDDVDRLRDALDNLADDVSPAHKKKKDREAAEAAGHIDNALPKLQEAIDRFRKNPNDPAARKALEDLLDQLEGDAEKFLGNPDLNKRKQRPGDKAAQLAHDLGKTADDIERDARRGDKPALGNDARKAADQTKDLKDKVKDIADKEKNPQKRKKLLDALNDLDNILPQFIRSANDVANNPNDPSAKKKMGDASDDLQDILDRLGKMLAPPTEQGIRDASQRAKDEGDKLKDAAKKGDKKGGQDALHNLEDALDDVLDRGRDAAAREKDPKRRKELEDALRDLEDLLDQLRNDANDALNNPKDPSKQKKLEDDLNEMGKRLDNIADKAGVKPVADVQDALDDLDRLQAANKRKDPKEVADATKSLANNLPHIINDSKRNANKVGDPQRRKNLLDAIGDLEKLLPQLVPTVKSALTDPNDKSKQDALDKLAEDMKKPLGNIQSAFKPTDENDANALAKDIEAALRDVKDKAHKGDKPGVDNGLKNAKDPMDKLKDLGKKTADKTGDPKRKNDLQDALNDLDKLMKELENAAKDAAANPKDQKKQDNLDDAVHKVNNKVGDLADLIKDEEAAKANTQKRAAVALANLRGAKKRSMDPRGLLEVADELAANFKNLMGDVKIKAYSGPVTSDKARRALELNDLLSELDAAANAATVASTKSNANEDVSDLLKGLSDLADAAAPAVGASLEDSLSHWAKTIEKKTKQLGDNPGSKTTGSIAEELAKLAAAVRAGAKSEFLISARTISVLINQYNAELRRLAANCPDPVLKDRLVKNGEALKNFSIQLKIMASVKAASSGNDPTAENQLTTLTHNLGQMLHATMTNVQVYQIKTSHRK